MTTPDKPKLISPNGETMDIPPEGALGLLALGHVGLQIWRQARKDAGEPSHWKKTEPESDNKEPNND
ncbi:hypothetical protein QUF74_01765 [Candidatus Halobeggiatoa sp. HSG11]|nr:hypothetical protein [Candidatus Halobeggiatoa sp. HSG11]